MKVNYAKIIEQLKGESIERPLSETLSGHATGEPFDKHVYKILKNKYKNKTFRQFEYLNFLYTKNPDAIGEHARKALFNSPTLMFLLSRGKDATNKWSTDSLFE